MAVRTAVWLAGLGCSMQVAAMTQVDGSGTTNPSKFFWQLMEMMQARARDDIRLTYRAVGSSNGQREFSSDSDPGAGGNYASSVNDFGAGDIPMDQGRFDGMKNAAPPREMIHVPFCLGAIGVFHNIPAAEVGNDGLKLSPCLLAKIFSGSVRTWDHADVKVENPNLNVPANKAITVCHRSDGSSSTTGFTGYLKLECSEGWTQSGSKITWDTSSGFQPNEGSPGVTKCISDNEYSIGYLDAGHGHNRNFQEAMLQNKMKNWLTSTDAIKYKDTNGENGIAAAAVALTSPPPADESWASIDLYAKDGEQTWPIVLISYIYLNKDMSMMDVTKVELLLAFVDMVMDEGQELLPTYSFNKVPTSWASGWKTTTRDLIQKPTGFEAYVFEPTGFEPQETKAWIGMGKEIISNRRNSYSLWKLNEIDLALADLVTRVESLETTLDDYGIVALHGSGTTNPKNWFAKAMRLMETRARAPLHLTYRAVGSTTGQLEFVGNAGNGFESFNHFGAGDIPMKSDNYNLLTTGKEMVHLPFALGAIGIFHNVPASLRGNKDIKLTACLLARIFGGDITTWDHADIKAVNPDLSPPANQKIMVGHRKKGSSSTGGVTAYLKKSCPDSWTRPASSLIEWPEDDNFVAVEGSQGMQNHIDSTPYSIGYLDAGHAHDLNFAEIALENKDKYTRTSKESLALVPNGVAEAGSQGVSASPPVFPDDASADWSGVELLDMPGENTWPIVLVSYLYVKKDQRSTNPKTAAALKAFIDFILDDPDDLRGEFGFIKPDTTLGAVATDGAATIMWPAAMESFQRETDTDPYNGMGVNIISAKRISYDRYEQKVLEDSLAELQAEVQGGAVASTTPSGVTAAAEDSDDDTLPLVLSIAALVVSLFSSIPGCLAFKRSAGGGSVSRSNLASAAVGPPAVVGSPQNNHE